MTAASEPIEWPSQLQAVHEDGRTMMVQPHSWNFWPDDHGQYHVAGENGRLLGFFNEDGSWFEDDLNSPEDKGWRIQNLPFRRVRWSSPVEAIHSDGRTEEVTFLRIGGDDLDEAEVQFADGRRRWVHYQTGDPGTRLGWRIRNRRTETRPQPADPIKPGPLPDNMQAWGGFDPQPVSDLGQQAIQLCRDIHRSGSLSYAKEVEPLYLRACAIAKGEPQPADTVTVGTMTEAEARARYIERLEPGMINSDAAVALLLSLGLICPDPIDPDLIEAR